jgi:hypothetical protein
MATSSNSTIQNLMDEVDRLDPTDDSLEAKLNLIAQKVADEQRKVKAKLSGTPIDDRSLVDPSDAFACEGCQ